MTSETEQLLSYHIQVQQTVSEGIDPHHSVLKLKFQRKPTISYEWTIVAANNNRAEEDTGSPRFQLKLKGNEGCVLASYYLLYNLLGWSLCNYKFQNELQYFCQFTRDYKPNGIGNFLTKFSDKSI